MARGDDDGNVGLRTNFAKQIEAIFLSEPEIEDDQVRLAAGEQAGNFITTRSRYGTYVVVFEIIRYQVPHRPVVLDHEAGGRFAFGGMAGLGPLKTGHITVGTVSLIARRPAGGSGWCN